MWHTRRLAMADVQAADAEPVFQWLAGCADMAALDPIIDPASRDEIDDLIAKSRSATRAEPRSFPMTMSRKIGAGTSTILISRVSSQWTGDRVPGELGVDRLVERRGRFMRPPDETPSIVMVKRLEAASGHDA